MHFTDKEVHEITNQGIDDIFSGTESYAQRYMQGMLFANDVVSLNDVNGIESLFGDIGSKIAQFSKWIWEKIKAVFKFLFDGGKTYTIVLKQGRDAITEYAKDYTLKADAGDKMYSKMQEVIKRIKPGTEQYLKDLRENNEKREKLSEYGGLKGITGAGVQETEKQFTNTLTYLNTASEWVRDAKTLKEWGDHVLDFVDSLSALQTWFGKNYVAHSSVRSTDSSGEKIKEAIEKDVGKVEDKDKQRDTAALIFKIGNNAVNCANYLNQAISSCNTFINEIKSKSHFNKK